jgi:hypothetical protein
VRARKGRQRPEGGGVSCRVSWLGLRGELATSLWLASSTRRTLGIAGSAPARDRQDRGARGLDRYARGLSLSQSPYDRRVNASLPCQEAWLRPMPSRTAAPRSSSELVGLAVGTSSNNRLPAPRPAGAPSQTALS